MDIVGKFISAVIAIIVLFVGTSLVTTNLFDMVTLERVKALTLNFTDEVKEQGKITPGMYENFIQGLDATGNLYDVKIIYTKDVVVPGDEEREVPETNESFYTDDIVAGIYNGVADNGAIIDGRADGEVHFNAGDYISVSVTNRDMTYFQKVSNLARMRSASTPRIEVHAGGEIRDENWD